MSDRSPMPPDRAARPSTSGRPTVSRAMVEETCVAVLPVSRPAGRES